MRLRPRSIAFVPSETHESLPAGHASADPNNPFSEPANFIDSLADEAGCARDIPLLQSLSINAIRAYSVDATANHDACMSALSSAGIYTMYACPPSPSFLRFNARR